MREIRGCANFHDIIAYTVVAIAVTQRKKARVFDKCPYPVNALVVI